MKPLHQAVVEAGSTQSFCRITSSVTDFRTDMVKSTASTEKPKRAGFMDLSAELRNRIYGYALVSPVPLRVAPISSDSGTVIKVASFYYLSPGLLATCRQIHQEATAMLYGGNTLHFWFAYMDSSIKPFLDAIGNSRRLIRSIFSKGMVFPLTRHHGPC